MAAVANQWHKDQRERPGSLKFPLRVLLFQSFLHSMGQALEKLTHDPAYKAEAIRLRDSSGAGSTPLPPMEPGGSSGRGSCQPDASEGGRGCSDVAGTHGAQCGPWGNNHKIPFHEETFGRAGRTHDHFQVGSGSQGDKDVPVLANPGVSVRQLRPPPGGGLHASGENGSIPPGSEDYRSDPQTAALLHSLRQLRLCNRANDCYANSTLLALLWCSAQHCQLEVALGAPLLVDLREVLSSSEPVHLWSRPSWRRCLRRWPDTGRQQDAAEFLTFLQVPAQLRLFAGSWALLEAHNLHDQGGVCPLFLSSDPERAATLNGMCALQGLIDTWSNSERTLGLTAGTQWRCASAESLPCGPPQSPQEPHASDTPQSSKTTCLG